MKIKRFIAVLLCFVLTVSASPISTSAEETASIYPYYTADAPYWFSSVDAASFTGSPDVKAELLMDSATGAVLYASNENERLPIASVTKIMVTLLIMEAIDDGKAKLSDTVTVSEHAASMGGSQVFLEAGEQMSIDDLMKSLVVVSANDASVALAEHFFGSEESFIAAMNDKAKALGMNDTLFRNTTGLDSDNGGNLSTAKDVALMTRELLRHETIFQYTTIWMDTIRNGAFGLANTNKLIRFYNGANGMKTGFTDKAMYCLSGTAKRGDMQLIAVVLGGKTSDARFSAAKAMLDFGFAQYTVVTPEKLLIENASVSGGTTHFVKADYTVPTLLSEKGKAKSITQTVTMHENLRAPIAVGDIIGTVTFKSGDSKVAEVYVYAATECKKIKFSSMFKALCDSIFALI